MTTDYIVRTFRSGVGWQRWGYEVRFSDGTRVRPFPVYKYGSQITARCSGIAHARREMSSRRIQEEINAT